MPLFDIMSTYTINGKSWITTKLLQIIHALHTLDRFSRNYLENLPMVLANLSSLAAESATPNPKRTPSLETLDPSKEHQFLGFVFSTFHNFDHQIAPPNCRGDASIAALCHWFTKLCSYLQSFLQNTITMDKIPSFCIVPINKLASQKYIFWWYNGIKCYAYTLIHVSVLTT